MLSVAAKRLWNRPLLTLLSILGVALVIGILASIPIFGRAVSSATLLDELQEISDRTGRPLFALRTYTLPPAEYSLTLQDTADLSTRIQDLFVSQVGLPLVSAQRQIESDLMQLRTGDKPSPFGEPHTVIKESINLYVVPGIESHIEVVEGEPMASDQSVGSVSTSNSALDVWLHQATADKMGISPGETFEVYHRQRGGIVPIRIAGLWQPRDPREPFWFSDPDATLRWKLLARPEDYAAIAEPILENDLGMAAWFLVLDDSRLRPERMQHYVEGIALGMEVMASLVPHPRLDSSPLLALEETLEREGEIEELLYAISVPIVGFLLYYVAMLAAIAMQWQEHETSIMVSRGVRGMQLILLGAIESLVLVGIGAPLGMILAPWLARAVGYTQSFLSFTWREPLPVTPGIANLATILAACGILVVARLAPVLRAAQTSVVAHERERSRTTRKPFWQRVYLDLWLIIPVAYAYYRLTKVGSLIAEAVDVTEETSSNRDPLLILAPVLFLLVATLLAIRLFPTLMQVFDWLARLGRQTTLYLSARQLSRQSVQYSSALLLIIAAMGLGAFMASAALSMDTWLRDQIYYRVGADVLLVQMPRPNLNEDPFFVPTGPAEGAWALPVDSYLEIPGVRDAARAALYPAEISIPDRRLRSLGSATYIGIDRADAPRVAFYRPDFGPSMGELMNLLALRQDAVLLSERFLEQTPYEIGDTVLIQVEAPDFTRWFPFTIVGAYSYFPTVYEERQNRTAVVGNLDYLYSQLGATLIHNVWLRIEPDADSQAMMDQMSQHMRVYVQQWVDVREEFTEELAKPERVGILGTLTIGFLAAAALSTVGLLLYSYASLRERLFRLTIMRAIGLSLSQVTAQVIAEYIVVTVYGIATGAGIGLLAAWLFTPFFQATDRQVIHPPTLIPLLAWRETGQIAGLFGLALIVAQLAVIAGALRRGVFQALRLGDRE